MSEKEYQKCREFLLKNGWTLDEEYELGACFHKDGNVGVIIDKNAMVFIGDSGDFLHKPIDRYTLIGVLIEYRQLPLNYKSIET